MSDVGSDYHVQLLGGFSVTRGTYSISLGPSSERLVALLACRARPVARHLAAGTLWPDRTESRAKANLRSVVYRTTSSHPGLVRSSSRHVLLNPSTTVDFHAATTAAQRIISGSSEDLNTSVREALTRDLLPCWYDEDWVIDEREAFRQNRLHALEILCLLLAKRARYGEAVDAALAAIRAEPLRESAHRTLVMVHLQEGNYREALRQYERCRALLQDELGIDPSPRLRDLVFGSCRHHAGETLLSRRPMKPTTHDNRVRSSTSSPERAGLSHLTESRNSEMFGASPAPYQAAASHDRQ